MRDNLLQVGLERGKTIAKKQAKINALGAIVKLALVNGQARSFGERFWKTVVIKEIVQ
jgi:hypothetical protein